MKKFSKYLLHVMDVERKLAEKLMAEIVEENPNAVLTNAAHDEISKILQFGYEILKEQYPQLHKEFEDRHNNSLRLRVVK